MADVNTLPINGRAITRKYHDNGDGTWSEVIATVSAGVGADTNVSIDQTTPGTTNGVVVNSSNLPTGAATAANQALEIAAIQAATPAGSNLIGKVGIDQTTQGTTNGIVITGTSGPAITTGTTSDALPGTSAGLNVARCGLYVWNGSGQDRMRGDLNGTVTQPFAMVASRWQYAPPTGGITNSNTAVVIMAAAGAGVRNYMARLQIVNNTLATAGEFVVLDGVTVIWRGYLLTTAQSQNFTFDVPLRGSANTSMSVQMVTTSATGNVYASAQGFQSAV